MHGYGECKWGGGKEGKKFGGGGGGEELDHYLDNNETS